MKATGMTMRLRGRCPRTPATRARRKPGKRLASPAGLHGFRASMRIRPPRLRPGPRNPRSTQAWGTACVSRGFSWLGRFRLLAPKLLLLAALPASAESALEPPDLSRYLKWGFAHVRPGFAIPGIGYDSNIFAPTGQPPEGDFAVKLSPRIEGVVLFGRTAFLTFKERLDYTAYQHHHEINYFENLGSARLTLPLRRFGLYADFGLNRLKDLPLSELDSRPIRREVRTGAGVILELGWRTTAEIGLVRSDWTVTDDDSPTSTVGTSQDRVEEGRQARLRYRLTGITRLTLDATNRSVTFADPALLRDADERAILPGVEIGAGGRLSGSMRAGPSRLDATAEGQPDYSGLVGDARIAWRISSASTLRIEGKREVGFAIYQNNPYYLRTSSEARLVHYLNRVFGLEAAVGRGRLSFPEALTAEERNDRLERYDAGVRIRLLENDLGRRVEYTLALSNQRRTSTVDAFDQSRTVVAVGASVGF